MQKLNNMLMQLRKNCNHPDIITADYDQSAEYPPADDLVAQAGKMQLLERLLTRLKPRGHKVLIFSQVRTPEALPWFALLCVCRSCNGARHGG